MKKIFRWFLPCLGLSLGFDSSSKSETSSRTENIDARVVGGAQSTNVSAKDSQVSVIATDFGAVQAGMVLGTEAIAASVKNTGALLAAGKSMFQGVLNSASDANESALGIVSSANERLALAYQSGQAGDQTSLKYAGFAVVGLAAVMLFGKLK